MRRAPPCDGSLLAILKIIVNWSVQFSAARPFACQGGGSGERVAGTVWRQAQSGVAGAGGFWSRQMAQFYDNGKSSFRHCVWCWPMLRPVGGKSGLRDKKRCEMDFAKDWEAAKKLFPA